MIAIHIPKKYCSKKCKSKQRHINHKEEINTQNRQKNKDHPEYNQNYKLKSKFNITLNDKKQMYKEQDGLCKICLLSMPFHGANGWLHRP